MKNIMRRRDLEGYKEVMNILQSYNSKKDDINISNDLSELSVRTKKIEFKTLSNDTFIHFITNLIRNIVIINKNIDFNTNWTGSENFKKLIAI